MYKRIINTYTNIHNSKSMLARYNDLPLNLKVLHASYAVLTEEFCMHGTVIGSLTATLWTDLLDYDLEFIVSKQANIKLMLDAILQVTADASFAKFSQLAVYNDILAIVKDDAYCMMHMENAALNIEM